MALPLPLIFILFSLAFPLPLMPIMLIMPIESIKPIPPIKPTVPLKPTVPIMPIESTLLSYCHHPPLLPILPLLPL